jgi:hypothetical protein
VARIDSTMCRSSGFVTFSRSHGGSTKAGGVGGTNDETATTGGPTALARKPASQR